ncbi:hypothetical protein Tco_1549102 [Tanacetum coccineum]
MNTRLCCMQQGESNTRTKGLYKGHPLHHSISEPLQLLYMDLFGPTSIRSIDHKSYSLVVTDDFSRSQGYPASDNCGEHFRLCRETSSVSRQHMKIHSAAMTLWNSLIRFPAVSANPSY